MQASIEGKAAGVRALQRTSAALECLVVATDEGRRELLTWAARDGGWATTACENARTALDYEQRRFLHLAIIDLIGVTPGEVNEHEAMVERFASCGQLLLVICGHEGCPREEVWSRRLGVWMYLPGASGGNELAALCGEARCIVERLHAAQRRNEAARTRPR